MKNNKKRIVSLSSIPPRFPYLKPTLESLLLQKSVDEVRLYLPKRYRRFPDYNGELPIVPDGIKICRVEDDLGPATKILPAIKDFEKQDVQILFCDDDLIYHKNWAKRLFDIQERRPGEAVATYGRQATKGKGPKTTYHPHAKAIDIKLDIPYRAKRLLSKLLNLDEPLWRPILFPGYTDILFGVGGVVVKPEFFDKEAFKIPNVAWAVDDIWLSAQLAKNNIPLYCPFRLPFAKSNDDANCFSLLESSFVGMERAENNRKAIEYCQNIYGIWR